MKKNYLEQNSYLFKGHLNKECSLDVILLEQNLELADSLQWKP